MGHVRLQEFEFPVVATDASLSLSKSLQAMGKVSNFSVTALTEFYLVWNATRQCFLKITHLPNLVRNSSSRVRIDSLSLRRLNSRLMSHLKSSRYAAASQRAIALRSSSCATSTPHRNDMNLLEPAL